jgi:4-hydroxy-tetrahydrodipicolinate synthase
MIVPPYYWKCSEEEVYRHYKMISEATKIPLILYHNPDLSKFYMRPEFVLRLTEIPHIVALKEVVTDVQHLQRLMALIGEKINVLQYTTAFLPALLLGAEGGTIDPFQLTPAIQCKKALEEGDIKKAVDLQQKMMSVYINLGGEAATGAVGFFKAATTIATGIDMGPPRPPYLPLTDEQHALLKSHLKTAFS